MNKLVSIIIKADADYFLSVNFISAETHGEVMSLLKGSDNKRIQLLVAKWLKEDADYFNRVTQALIREHWWLYPAWLMTKFIPKELNKYVQSIYEQYEG